MCISLDWLLKVAGECVWHHSIVSHQRFCRNDDRLCNSVFSPESTVFVKICGETGEKGDGGFISPSGLSQQGIGGAVEACVSEVRASVRVKHC